VIPRSGSTGERHVGMLCFEPDPLPPRWRQHDSRYGRLAAHVADLVLAPSKTACRRWGPHRVAVVLGSSMGESMAIGQGLARRAPAFAEPLPSLRCEVTLELLAAIWGVRGPTFAISSSCSSSGKAIGSARRLIEADLADAVLVVGIETLCEATLRALDGLELTSRRACRPLSKEREGLNLGEGAAVLLLERSGAAEVALLSVGESSDAAPPHQPHPRGAGVTLALERALTVAGVHPSRVGHANVDAKGVLAGDLAEVRGVCAVLGEGARVVATQGYTGHLLGAAGATQAVFTAMAIEQGWLPASLGAEPVDPDLAMHVVCERTPLESAYALSTSVAFGGSTVAVLLGAREP
jgi:3-oxoacyl-[acyl-carrier-protein] synthase I